MTAYNEVTELLVYGYCRKYENILHFLAGNKNIPSPVIMVCLEYYLQMSDENILRTFVNDTLQLLNDAAINDIYKDLSDGVILLKLLDKMKPGTVKWRRVR
eukprot:355253_1